MDKIKILVACHKPGPVYHDDVYTPIHVGRSISKYKDEMAGMLGDDTGDNISEKNPYYCELTAQYWAWKNLHDVEYVGFCHYRRFFDISITKDNIDHIFKNSDVLLLGYKSKEIVERNVVHYITIEDITIFLMVLRKLYPEYEQTVINYLWSNYIHGKNMLVCRKDIFDSYANWIFSILSECEKYIKLSPYARGKRAFAYLGEFFMPVFFIHNHFQIKNTKAINMVGENSSNTILYKLGDVLKDSLFAIMKPGLNKPHSFDDYFLPEVLVGFKNDGIII